MTDDPISRRDAKEAIEARAKPYELGPHRSFEHGVYQGLMMARNSVCALPALDADGRWEKLLQGVKFLVKSPVLLYSDKVSAAGVVAELNALLVPFLAEPTPSAAERRPAVDDTGAGSAGGAT